MLSDYAMYIENIRNSLMQCGVIFPQIDNINSEDYGVLFHIGEKLNDIMYFYKIMYCSGNMEEMFLPLGKSYKGTVRMEAFSEFKEDILPSLKEMYGDEEEEDNFNFGVLLDIDGVEEDEPEEWVNEDISAEDTLIDANDLFGDEDEDIVESEPEDEVSEDLLFTPVDMSERFISSGASLWGASNLDKSDFVTSGVEQSIEWVSNGTDLFSFQVSTSIEKEVKNESDTKWVRNGADLFSFQVNSDSTEDVWESDFNDDTEQEEDISGGVGSDVFTDTDEEDIWVEESDEDVFNDSDSDDIWASEEDTFNDSDSDDIWEESDEDVFSDSDSEDIWVDEPEDTFNDSDSDDIWSEEPEEVFSDSDSDDIWVSDEDEDILEESDDVNSDDEDIWVSEEDEDVPEEPKQTIRNDQKPKLSKPIQNSPITTGVERDIVDSVQDAASAALTSAKRFIVRLTRPEE